MSYTLFTDLDRTLIPNGDHPADTRALSVLQVFSEQIGLDIIYVSGRDLNLVEQAITDYDLPRPIVAITDVGSRIHYRQGSTWLENESWAEHLHRGWDRNKLNQLADELADIQGLSLQESSRQSTFKLSYYAETGALTEIHADITGLCLQIGFDTNIICSIDETSDTGLIDILPPQASKLQAMEFLIAQHNYDPNKLVFAGDSGNDMNVLISPFKSVLVNNATHEVKQQALSLVLANNLEQTLYIARGGFFALNGHYSSGILEGLAHFFPEHVELLKELLN